MTKAKKTVWIPTGFSDFDDLLSSGPGKTGVCCHPAQGFFGVVLGAAGTGKSIFALQLCCSWVRSREDHTAIYVGQELPEVVESKIRDSFSYFGPKKVRIRKGIEEIRDGGALYIEHLPFIGVDQASVLGNIVEMIKRLGVAQRNRVLLCVDNANAIQGGVPDAFLQAVAPTDAKGNVESNQFKKIRSGCADNQINTFFILEQSPEELDLRSIAVTGEAYATDLLVHLGIDTQAGFRQRYLEILKAKNQYCFRGRHSFSIVGAKVEAHLRDKEIRTGDNWGIRIYPSVAAQLSKLARREATASSGPTFKLGIVPEDEPGREFDVDRNTCTVLVSDIDINATLVACEFARRAAQRPVVAGDVGVEDPTALYISFLHPENALRDLCPDARGVTFRYFAPEHIDQGKLMQDIDLLIARYSPSVVVVDNAFELTARYPLIDRPAHFLSALIELFRARNVTSLIVDIVEVGVGGNPMAKSVVAGMGENVLLLRSVEFQSQAHTVFAVQKHRSPSKQVRQMWHLEKVADERNVGPRFVARRTFEAYKNVLTGKPEAVTFAVSLYQDEPGSPLTKYVDGMSRALKRTFGRSIEVDCYSSEEYANVQNLTLLSERSALADCHIMALDEFWLARLIDNNRLEDISAYAARLERALRFGVAGGPPIESTSAEELGIDDPFVTAASDIATLYHPNWPFVWYAVPVLNTFGVLCCDPHEVRGQFRPDEKVRAWLNREKGGDLTWQDLVRLKRAMGKRMVSDSGRRFFGFCLDHVESAVSFLIELALGHGEPFLDSKEPRTAHLKLNLEDPSWSEALALLLDLVEEDDLRQLALREVRRASSDKLSIFSRQWIGSLASLRGLHPDRAAVSRLQVFELPRGAKKSFPTPVSGTWYLGILKGSAAVQVGVEILKAFCTSDSEVSKWNVLLGAPVRASFYGGANEDNAYGPFGVPYSGRFAKMGEIQGQIRASLREATKASRDGAHVNVTGKRTEARNTFQEAVLKEQYPFHRMTVVNYDAVSMVLWRMMGCAASAWLRAGMQRKRRSEVLELAIETARKEWKIIEGGRALPNDDRDAKVDAGVRRGARAEAARNGRPPAAARSSSPRPWPTAPTLRMRGSAASK